MIRRLSFAAARLLPLAMGVVGVVALPAGCSVTFATASGSSSDAGGALNDWEAGSTDQLNPGDADGSGGAAGDAAVPGYQGSPLCNASSSTGCFPDDPASAQSCNIPVDAGAGLLDAGSPYGCHVSPSANSQTGPAQVCIVAGTGIDGAACTTGADCAAGFECVGEGTCRHYCCDPSACDGDRSFCDIQTILDAPVPETRVPVCMPVRTCMLLSTDYCQANETCAVVKPSDGTTSCVPVGPQTVGQECETDHCGANLVCLGPVGTRVCYQLCHTSSSGECQSGQTCVGSAPEFQDPTVGICQ